MLPCKPSKLTVQNATHLLSISILLTTNLKDEKLKWKNQPISITLQMIISFKLLYMQVKTKQSQDRENENIQKLQLQFHFFARPFQQTITGKEGRHGGI